jgi:hypothetical protein
VEAWQYCANKCRAQCCYAVLPEESAPVRCPKLGDDCKCTVYQERYREGQPDLVVVGYYKSSRLKELGGDPANRPFYCGRVHQIAARGGLAPDIARRCCVLHPELLKEES